MIYSVVQQNVFFVMQLNIFYLHVLIQYLRTYLKSQRGDRTLTNEFAAQYATITPFDQTYFFINRYYILIINLYFIKSRFFDITLIL